MLLIWCVIYIIMYCYYYITKREIASGPLLGGGGGGRRYDKLFVVEWKSKIIIVISICKSSLLCAR